MISLEDMRSIIQEWMAQANGIKELAQIYATIVSETEIQLNVISKVIEERIGK